MNSLQVLRTASRTSAAAGAATAPAAGAAWLPLAVVLPAAVLAAAVLAAARVPRPLPEAGGLSGMEVGLQTVPAALAAEAGFTVSDERAGGVEPVVGVGPHHAGPQPLGQPQDAAALLRPDPGGQDAGGVVRLGHRFLRRAEGQHGQHRAEDLLARDPVRRADPGEQRRREPVTAVGKRAGRLP